MSPTRWHTERKESFFVLSSSKTTTIICSIWRKRRKINAEIEIFRFWNRLYHPSITCIHHFHYYTLHSFLLQFHQHPNRPESLCNYLHRHHVQEDCFYCVTFWIFKRKWYALFVSESSYLIFFNVLQIRSNQYMCLIIVTSSSHFLWLFRNFCARYIQLSVIAEHKRERISFSFFVYVQNGRKFQDWKGEIWNEQLEVKFTN